MGHELLRQRAGEMVVFSLIELWLSEQAYQYCSKLALPSPRGLALCPASLLCIFMGFVLFLFTSS